MRQSSLRSLVYALGLLALSSPLISVVVAQQAPPAAPAPLINVSDNALLHGFKWRPIGPVGQGVRIDDFAVDEKNPSTYYIGFAVSGILKTVNNGTTFTSVFDTYGAGSIADIDTAMMQGAAHPMGPFSLADFIGLDVVFHMANNLLDEYRESRFAPPPVLRRMMLNGQLGRKSGKGFYDYSSRPPVPNTALVR